MTPAERKAKIQQLNTEIREKRAEAVDLAQTCPHKIVVQEPDPKYGDYGYAQCEGCDTTFGWYCPDSPDQVCHYYTKDDKVELIDGTLIDFTYTGYQCSDWCLYCGHPDERK